MEGEILLRFKANWADEMDLDGCWVVDEKWWDEHKAKAVACNGWPLTCSIGTNEEIIYDSADDYLSCFHEISATPDEVAMVKRLLGVQVGHVELLHDSNLINYDDDYDGN